MTDKEKAEQEALIRAEHSGRIDAQESSCLKDTRILAAAVRRYQAESKANFIKWRETADKYMAEMDRTEKAKAELEAVKKQMGLECDAKHKAKAELSECRAFITNFDAGVYCNRCMAVSNANARTEKAEARADALQAKVHRQEAAVNGCKDCETLRKKEAELASLRNDCEMWTKTRDDLMKQLAECLEAMRKKDDALRNIDQAVICIDKAERIAAETLVLLLAKSGK